jgi:hypothetical protein
MGDERLIEAVARVLCVAAGLDPDSPTFDIYVPGDPVAGIPWAGYRPDARNAIAAIRSSGYAIVPLEGEGFEAAVERMVSTYELHRSGCAPGFDDFVRASAAMMLRAALSPGDDT